ncbi:MAG: ElaB/YqjD/DUF883 family membrane-anchored ribosome-binding protein [Sulfitobacter sp.]|jgi:ElaB/YqjD/DUF883 family membrane-anchored ribosome-binding protein
MRHHLLCLQRPKTQQKWRSIMARASTNGSAKEMTVADLNDQIETLRNDLSTLTGSIAELGKAKKSQLGDAAAHQVEIARQKGLDAADALGHRAKDAQHQAEDFVKTQPATALGIAAGVGFLVGMMSSRR